MKKIILIILCMSLLVTGAGYKFYLSQYEEVCIQHQMNVTAELTYCADVPAKFCINNSARNWTWCTYDYNNTTKECHYKHKYTATENCVEFQLRRKTDIEPFIYSFDWCEVYPGSEECLRLI